MTDSYALKSASSEIKNNKDIVMIALTGGGSALEFASDNLKNDKEVVKLAISEYGPALEFASEELKNDKEIVMAAILQNIYSLQFASNELKNDKDIAKAAISKDRYAFVFTSNELKDDKDFMMSIISKDGYALQYASEQLMNDKEIVLAAVSNTIHALEFASKEIKNDEEIIQLVHSKNPNAFKYSPETLKKDKDFVIKSIELSYENINNVSIDLLSDIDFLRQIAPFIKGIIFLKNVPETIFNDKILVDELYHLSNGNLIINYTISLETENYKILGDGPLLKVTHNNDPYEEGGIYSLRNLRVEDKIGNLLSEIIKKKSIFDLTVWGPVNSNCSYEFLGGYGIYNNEIMECDKNNNLENEEFGKYFICHYALKIIDFESYNGKIFWEDEDVLMWDGRTLTIKPKS